MADLSMVFDLLARDRASSEVGKVGDAMDKSGDQADALGDRVRGMFGALAGAAAGAGLAVGASFGAALEQQGQNRTLTAQLGLDPAQSAAAGEAAGSIYAGAYGESLEQVNGAIGAVASSIDGLGDVSSDATQQATKDALNFASAFGTDVNESVGTVGNLIRQGFAADAEAGFDLLTAAYQRVPAAMRDELPDILNEYGTNFRALGYTGEQAFAMLTTAADGGQVVLDKTGDALKEFAILSTDMSATSVEAYKTLGMDAGDMANKILAGGETAQQATQNIAQGLLDIDDPAKRANTAIALFGTPLEDLSVDQIPTFLGSLANVGPGMTDAAGAAAAMDQTLGSGLGPRLDSLKRGAEVAAGEGIGALIAGFGEGSTSAGGWQGTLQNLAATLEGSLGGAFSTVSGFVTGTAMPALSALFGYLAEHPGTVSTIATLITGVLGAAFLVWGARALMAAGQNALAWLSVVTSSSTGAAATQRSALQVVARWAYMSVAAVLHGAKVAAVWTVQMVAAAARGAASLALSAARVVAGFVLMSAQAALHGARIGAVWTAQMVAAAARGAASLAVSAARVVAGWVLMAAQSLLQAGRMAAAWLIAMGPIGILIAAVVGLVIAVVANWDKIKSAVSAGAEAVAGFVLGIPGKIAGLGSSLYSAGRDMIQGLINGAGSLLRNIGAFFLNMVPAWIRGPFESALGIASPSKVFRQYGINIGQGLVVGLTGSSKAVQDTAKKLATGITKAWEDYTAKRKKLNTTLVDREQRLRDAIYREYQAGVRLEEARRKSNGDASSSIMRSAVAAVGTAQKGVRDATRSLDATRSQIADLRASYGKLGDERAVRAAVAALQRGDDRLVALAKNREQVAKQLEAARKRLEDATKVRNDYAASVRDSARQFASLTSIKVAGSPAVLVDELQDRLKALQTFRGQLAKLAKLGVRSDVYEQIASAGVEAGGATADAILAGGPRTVAQVNKLQAGIASESAKLGTDASRKLYQAGVNAATGLVNGLSAQSKQLQQAATRLAANLEAAVKRRLGIRSPSRVFEGVGTSIGEGLAQGIKSMRPVVADELAKLADTQAVQSLQAAVGVDTGTAGTAPAYRPPTYDTTGAGAAAAPASSTRTVNVTGVVGPEQVAALVRREDERDEFLAGAGT